jgi:plastocyanin
MRIRWIALGCAAVVVCAGVGAAVVHAAGDSKSAPKTVGVTVGPNGNLVFSPSTAKARVGDTVKWTWGSSGHTSTDTTGLKLWDTGTKGVNFTFSFTFAHAGTYSYECSNHAFRGMTGKVRVPLTVTKTSATAITLTWASAAPPANFAEDVQEQLPGAAKFTTLQGKTTALSQGVTLTSGTTAFRARYLNPSTGKKTAWSPVSKVTIP